MSLITAAILLSLFPSISQDTLVERDCLVYKVGSDTPYTGKHEVGGPLGSRTTGQYVNGLRHGTWIRHQHHHGTVKVKTQYNHGCIVKIWGKNVRAKGKYVSDCNVEKLKEYGQYCSLFEEDPKKNGKWKRYSGQGKLIQILIYKNGELAKSKKR